MNIPGFKAEASLGRSKAFYVTTVHGSLTGGSILVTPSQQEKSIVDLIGDAIRVLRQAIFDTLLNPKFICHMRCRSIPGDTEAARAARGYCDYCCENPCEPLPG